MILWPAQASTVARQVDDLVFLLLGVSAALGGGVACAIVFFCVKYREGSAADRTPLPPRLAAAIEVLWISGPILLGLFLFWRGAEVFARERRPPPDAMEVRVVGKQWMWHVQHPEGRREINELHAPVGRPVRLAMTSQDVIHSFFVPEFRVKQDVLPGRVTMVWFEATRPGVFQIACTQYCGTAHAEMRGRVIAQPPEEYARWLSSGEAVPPLDAAARGAALFERYSCSTCHLRAGGKGPPLMRVYGRAVRLSDDRVVLADDDYLRESIVDPGAKIVHGYPNIMPSFRGRISEEDLADLLEYLRTLGRGREAAP